jgi:hypothetical protein
MIMRVKLVSRMSSEGATASSVRAMIIVMLELGLARFPPRLTETEPPELDVLAGDWGLAGACAVTGVLEFDVEPFWE